LVPESESAAARRAAAEALLAASRAFVAISARSIASTTEVTMPQFRMLMVLSQSTSILIDLARSLGVVPSTAMRMVDRLIGMGLVQRRVLPGNRRETRLSLTSTGFDVVERVLDRRLGDLQSVVARFPASDLDDLARIMRLFASTADGLWSPSSPANDEGRLPQGGEGETR
jgi:DNA-binding MarR family transcriptional regulator